MVTNPKKSACSSTTEVKCQPLTKSTKLLSCCSIKKYSLFVPLSIIRAYRYFISPLTGQHCRFYPSCSQYAEEAYQCFGFVKGTALSIKRLIKCHPWHQGGIDLLPDNKTTNQH